MGQHLEDGAFHPLRVDDKNPQRHESHVGNGRVRNQFFHVVLGQRHQRCINNGNQRQGKDQPRQLGAGMGEHRQREP